MNNQEGGGTDEEMEMDEHESEETATAQPSLVSEAYNSDDSDETKQSELDNSQKSNDSNVTLGSIRTTSGPVLISTFKPVLVQDKNAKPDLSELTPSKTSNRDTMSYLKAKRIQRHKNNNNPNDSIKKQKLSE